MGTQPLLTGDNLVYPWSVTILGCPSCIFSHPRFSWVIFVHPSSGLQVFSAVRTCQFDQHISIASLQLLSLKALLQMFAGVRTCHCCFLNIQINCQGTTYLLIMQSILTQTLPSRFPTFRAFLVLDILAGKYSADWKSLYFTFHRKHFKATKITLAGLHRYLYHEGLCFF